MRNNITYTILSLMIIFSLMMSCLNTEKKTYKAPQTYIGLWKYELLDVSDCNNNELRTLEIKEDELSVSKLNCFGDSVFNYHFNGDSLHGYLLPRNRKTDSVYIFSFSEDFNNKSVTLGMNNLRVRMRLISRLDTR